MKLLLVANHPDDARAVTESLTREGHSVTTCHDQNGGPCRGVNDIDACPLEQSVDLAVIARSARVPRGIGEMGSVCAARHRVGVVEIDPAAPSDRSIYELGDDAERHIRDEYVAVITEHLEPILADTAFQVSLTRRDRDVHVFVTLTDSVTATKKSAIADRAHAAARRYDRFASVIDVSVDQSQC